MGKKKNWLLLLPTLLLILALDWETAEKPHRVSSCISFASVLLCLFSCWLGLASFFLWTGDAGSAVRVYPAYTPDLVRQLAESPEAEQAEIAERILRMNDSVSLAHNVAAHEAFNEGNILGMVEHKQDVLRLSKYRRDEYLDYLNMLIVSRELYSSRGDENSTSLCTALMREVPTRMQQVLDSTSVLGWKIRDLPDLNLPEEYLQAIEKSS